MNTGNVSASISGPNCMTPAEQQKIKEQTDHWYSMIIESGREMVRAQLRGNRDFGKNLHISLALERYDRELQDKKDAVRDEREIETLDIASTARDNAGKSVVQSWLAIGIAGLAVVVTVIVALLSD